MSDASELNPYQREFARLLALSSLTPGRYEPTPAVKTVRHVAVLVGGVPAMLLGDAEDPASIAQAEGLVASATAEVVFDAAGKHGGLAVGFVLGADIHWPAEVSAIVAKPSGQVEDGTGSGPVMAIVLDDPNLCIATALCTLQETALALDPDAPQGLDDGWTLSRLARMSRALH